MTKQLKIGSALLFTLFCIGGCAPKEAPAEAGPLMAAEDTMKEVAADFAAGQEARGWLMREDTALFEISKDVGREIVEDFYTAGSPRVVMSDADKFSENSQGEIGATFIVEVPEDPAVRKKIFEVERKYFEADADGDLGQRYLVVLTD